MKKLKSKVSEINCKTRTVLGVPFFIGSHKSAVKFAMRGGLVVAPSGPGLAVDLVKSHEYREAISSADLVIIDSSALVIFWRLIGGEWLPRFSGLMFLRLILQQAELKKSGSVLWVMPSSADQSRNLEWLATQGFTHSKDDCYIAPFYSAGTIVDEILLERIELHRPKVVMVTIGGGVQEQLGYFLRKRLSYRPGIFCIGAAIAFLSGGQAKIPAWSDHLMIGWLLRIGYSPRLYASRYWAARSLLLLILKNRENMPPLKKVIDAN